MATIDAAHALGVQEDLGSLEPGKKADIVLVDMRKPHPPRCLHGNRPTSTVRLRPMHRYRSACTFWMSAGQRLLM